MSFKLLAIDTSTDACSVALYLDQNIIERYEWAPKAHTRLLLPMIDNLLKEADITLMEVNALAFGRGPGSFTGIRIACSVIQALSFGISKPIVPVSTLRAQAQGAYRLLGVTKVFASIDARKQEIYWGLFEVDQNGVMQAVKKELIEPIQQVTLPEGTWQPVTEAPRAKDIAYIAAFEYQQGNWVSAINALPTYLKDKLDLS